MKVFGKNRIGTIVLIIAVLIIWGIILFRVFNHFSDNNDVQINITTESNILPKQILVEKSVKTEEIKYIKLEQDPFTFTPIKPIRKAIPKKQKKEPIIQVERINYSIKGAIIANTSKVIIFNDETNSETIFLREGEEYKYIKIIEIKPQTVLLTEYKKSKVVSIK